MSTQTGSIVRRESSTKQMISEVAEQACCHSIRCKVSGAALGILLLGIATVLLYSGMNAVVAYTAIGSGSTLILGVIILGILDRVRDSQNKAAKADLYE